MEEARVCFSTQVLKFRQTEIQIDGEIKKEGGENPPVPLDP